MRVLVTGGAGYIGSVVTAALLDGGHEVTVLDDLSTGHEDAVPAGAAFVPASLHDSAPVLADVRPEAVLHFAAKSLVGESQEAPERYWHNNVGGSLALLEAMRAADCRRIVFSSTAATYGEPDEVPIQEKAATVPTNPYGASKLAVDMAIGFECAASAARGQTFGATSLRYFNVAGASGDYGELHDPETHLIPLVLRVAAGLRESVQIYGTDYPTDDGTAVRDYIHVEDLARAHLLALDAITPGTHAIYNLGNGTGFSVRQVVEASRAVTGHPIPAVEVGRRAGDPAVLVAGSDKIRRVLGWVREKPELEALVGDAWAWIQANRHRHG
jgi:UDP-glucose 4-epimerase